MANGSSAGFSNGPNGPTVRELHVDFILQEEFFSNSHFLRRFISCANHPDEHSQVVSVQRSVSDALGEADIVVIYKGYEGKNTAILIEDKIRAAFQPDQPERYRERGKIGIGHAWDLCWTCLIAPASYIKDDHRFDAAVTLETISDLLAEAQDLRSTFKCQVLQEAINKCSSTGVQVVDKVMTEFRKRHYDYCREFFCGTPEEFILRSPADTYKGDTWFEFRCPRTLPKGAYITHKSTMGAVDLAFPNTKVETLLELSQLLASDMFPVQTAKSASIRINVQPITDFSSFDNVRPDIERSVDTVKRLLALYVRERTRFRSVLARQPEAR